MRKFKFANDLYISTGSTFDGSIAIKDIHGDPFYISPGDEISFFIRDADDETADPAVHITLTCCDEIMGEYPFKLTPENTALLNGNYYYYAFLRFADGDYYQIVPHTPLFAGIRLGTLSYSENKITAVVPRVMPDRDYAPPLNELTEFVSDFDSSDNTLPVCIRRIKNTDIVLTGNNINTAAVTPQELVGMINSTIQSASAENSYISGFFHTDESPELIPYRNTVISAFGNRFIDTREILKTPVLAKNSERVVSSTAFDLIRQKPSSSDILSIIHDEYPACIMNDDMHFNEKGCYAAAKVLLNRIFNL